MEMQKDNVGILRTHLETHTYVSGSNSSERINYRKEGKKPRRKVPGV